jgi:hypothetical protein
VGGAQSELLLGTAIESDVSSRAAAAAMQSSEA